jgi:cytidine deaminase
MRHPTDAELELYERARRVSGNAYVPHSSFPVGAALQTADGSVFAGVNVENDSFGLTCCAERTAVFTAVTAGHTAFTAIAVHGTASSVPPCGACRQVLSQFADGLVVIFPRDGGLVAAELDELLPVQFEL